MKQLTIIVFMLCGLLLTTAAHASSRNLKVTDSSSKAQKRVALVIGNAKYQGAPPLRNPVNDAKAMSDALNALNFEVIEVTDATQKEMLRAVTAFGSKLNAETAALFFYAGHGLQVRGKNYIIPVDAEIETEAAVASEAVSVDAVLEQLNVSTISIVILDACRNNPFERSFRKMGGGGLAQMDAPKGSFIAYATAPGKTAADGDGRHGLFTQELLKQINAPGLTLESVFKRVRSNVAAKSGDAQMPWDSSSMTGEFYFKPSSGTQVANMEPVPPPNGGNISIANLNKQPTSNKVGWVKVDSTDTFTLYANLSTIHKIGDIVTMWVMVDYKEVIDIGNDKFVSTVHRNEFDCKEEKYRSVASERFSGHMGKGNVLESNTDIGGWIQAIQTLLNGCQSCLRQLKKSCGISSVARSSRTILLN